MMLSTDDVVSFFGNLWDRLKSPVSTIYIYLCIQYEIVYSGWKKSWPVDRWFTLSFKGFQLFRTPPTIATATKLPRGRSPQKLGDDDPQLTQDIPAFE